MIYYTRDNVGKCKYTVNWHDGRETHDDGSPFFNIKIFKNKKAVAKFIAGLKSKGYVEQ
jgi:hypothetical protein